MKCLFCEIAQNKIPSYTIYENEMVKVFLDINPESNGHCLIIPKEHFLDLDDIPLQNLNEIFIIAKEIKKKLENALKCDGVIIFQNNGVAQEIKHFHLHLKPYYQKESKSLAVKDIYEIIKKTE